MARRSSDSANSAGFVRFRWMKRIFPRSDAGEPLNRAMVSTMKGCGISDMGGPGTSPSAKNVPSR
jgi:hypothetical protein